MNVSWREYIGFGIRDGEIKPLDFSHRCVSVVNL
jgi:hypothetical protein